MGAQLQTSSTIVDFTLSFNSILGFLLKQILKGNFLSLLPGEDKYYLAQTEGTIKIIFNLSMSGHKAPKRLLGNIFPQTNLNTCIDLSKPHK